MIVEYHRPESVNECIQLLARESPPTYPLGGGTVLNLPNPTPIAAVDLQDLGLGTLEKVNHSWTIGATVTLQQMIKEETLYPALKSAIRHEATYNIRHMATVAGALVSGDGRSPFAAVMLALGAQIVLIPGDQSVPLGEYLLFREGKPKGRLITQVVVPSNLKLAYEYVARTPADLPIVCAAVVQWPSGRTRVVLGGYGKSVLLAFDGPDSAGVENAAQDAYREAGDQWASAEYRSNIAAILTRRCLQS
jgi:putative selenate reductase FAD-binding subunit